MLSRCNHVAAAWPLITGGKKKYVYCDECEVWREVKKRAELSDRFPHLKNKTEYPDNPLF